jgi:3-oxoacyl-(acyl-carrier-protein) synthase
MKLAMAMADDIGGEKKIDYVNSHGTSTPVGDLMELDAIKTVFTEKGYQPYVGSTKSLSGHALGAAGVHEAIYSLIMMRDGFLAESVRRGTGCRYGVARHGEQRMREGAWGSGGKESGA